MVQYNQNMSAISGIVFHIWGNPFQFRQTVERETLSSGGHGNRQGPHRDPRDFWVYLGAVVGIVICCTIGAIIGAFLSGFGGVFLGIVAGLFFGGLGGSWAGEQIKKKKYRQKQVSRKETEPGKGPFIG